MVPFLASCAQHEPSVRLLWGMQELAIKVSAVPSADGTEQSYLCMAMTLLTAALDAGCRACSLL
jgi:hypothetical protein